MNRLLKYLLILPVLFAVWLFACKAPAKKEAPEEGGVTGTPVTITSVSTEPLSEYIDLNATAAFLQKNYVKANVNGYVQEVNASPGKYVTRGQTLFIIKTKEAQSVGNNISKLDTSFRFTGVNYIKASSSGYITQLNHLAGDYVQDGEQLAIISDEGSFAFILNLPYELKPFLSGNKTVDMTLSDGTTMKGTIASTLPMVDAASQTLNVVIKVGVKELPESLVARVRLIKTNKTGSLSLPKAAVLTNDVQSEFWVMQMIDSTTAVKVPIKKGIETNAKVEILEPKFMPEDKILLTGNYGLPDTAKVRVEATEKE